MWCHAWTQYLSSEYTVRSVLVSDTFGYMFLFFLSVMILMWCSGMFDMCEGERTAAYVVNSLKGNRCEHSWGRRHFNPVLDVRESDPAACFTLNRIYSCVDGVETHCDASALQSFVDTICCLTARPFKWSVSPSLRCLLICCAHDK